MSARRQTPAAPALAVLALSLLAGCDSWDSFQKPPNISSPGSVSQIPATAMNEPTIAANETINSAAPPRGSLWRQGSKTFFRDPRARGVGDLLTVSVNLQEQAEFANQLNLARTTANSASISNLWGLGSLLTHAFPSLSGTDAALNVSGNNSTQGQGDIKRSENIVVKVAATVLQVMPNHNLEIAGSQEIRLNNELRQLQIRGIVRPEDIRSDNTIASEKIAEARIDYGGRGVSSTVQRPTWGQDVLTRASPF